MLTRDDVLVDTYRPAGTGNWSNCTLTGVSVVHLPSGLTASSEDTRCQHKNLATALQKLNNQYMEHKMQNKPQSAAWMRNPHKDLKPSFDTLREQHAQGLPRKATLGQVDAGLNNGRRMVHLEFKDIESDIFDWVDLRNKNIGQYLNYADACKMAKESTAKFIERSESGQLSVIERNVSRHMALLVWHNKYNEVDPDGYGFDAINNVIAWQWMFTQDGNVTHSDVVSGYTKPHAWLNLIHRFYGVTQVASGKLRCLESQECISLLSGKDVVPVGTAAQIKNTFETIRK